MKGYILPFKSEHFSVFAHLDGVHTACVVGNRIRAEDMDQMARCDYCRTLGLPRHGKTKYHRTTIALLDAKAHGAATPKLPGGSFELSKRYNPIFPDENLF